MRSATGGTAARDLASVARGGHLACGTTRSVADDAHGDAMNWWRRQRHRIRVTVDPGAGRVQHLSTMWPGRSRRYRGHQVEYSALIVVYRALFLAICVMLWSLVRAGGITHVMPGRQRGDHPERAGACGHRSGCSGGIGTPRSRSAVLDVLGRLTLLLGHLPAKALREGSGRCCTR